MKTDKKPTKAFSTTKNIFSEGTLHFPTRKGRRVQHHQVQTTHGPTPVRQTPTFNRDRLGPNPAPRPERRPEPEWTSFSMPRAAILREIKGKPFFQAPTPMRASTDIRDASKHCDYHETHGHTTEGCLALKYFLERLLREGQINQYLPRQITNGTPSNNKGNNPSTSNVGNKEKNIVNMVIGGNQSPPASPSKSEVLSISQREQGKYRHYLQ